MSSVSLPWAAIYVFARSPLVVEAKRLRCLQRGAGEGELVQYVEDPDCRDPRMERDRLERDTRGRRVRLIVVDHVTDFASGTREDLRRVGRFCYRGADVVEASGPLDTRRLSRSELLVLARSFDEGYKRTRELGIEAAREEGRRWHRQPAIVASVLQLVNEYGEGTSISALAEKWGTSRQTIRRTLERAGAYRKPEAQELRLEVDARTRRGART
jgi:hypothetical protein